MPYYSFNNLRRQDNQGANQELIKTNQSPYCCCREYRWGGPEVVVLWGKYCPYSCTERVKCQRQTRRQLKRTGAKWKDLTYFLQHTKVRAARPANINGTIKAAYTSILGSVSASAKTSATLQSAENDLHSYTVTRWQWNKSFSNLHIEALNCWIIHFAMKLFNEIRK